MAAALDCNGASEVGWQAVWQRARTEVSVPFRAGAEGYASYRIPAVVATAAGTSNT